MKKIIFAVVLSLVLILAGCADVTNTVKVDKKGERPFPLISIFLL